MGSCTPHNQDAPRWRIEFDVECDYDEAADLFDLMVDIVGEVHRGGSLSRLEDMIAQSSVPGSSPNA